MPRKRRLSPLWRRLWDRKRAFYALSILRCFSVKSTLAITNLRATLQSVNAPVIIAKHRIVGKSCLLIGLQALFYFVATKNHDASQVHRETDSRNHAAVEASHTVLPVYVSCGACNR